MLVVYSTDVPQRHLSSCLLGDWQERKLFLRMNLNGSPSRKLVLLAPSAARVPGLFRAKETDRRRHQGLLEQMQRLRAEVYLQDGAIDASSLVDGRHQSELDPVSWHLLVVNEKGRVQGGARFHQHTPLAVQSDLTAARCPLAHIPEWADALNGALESELAFARDLQLPFVELGGWALGEEIRGSTEALRIALGTYAFWELMGSAVCISTATHRNCSASILRRIGGRAVRHEHRDLPTYFDSKYNCQMELLRFYSWMPNPRYHVWISQLKEEIRQVQVVAPHVGVETWQTGPVRRFAQSA
jgi:hypothetical protein